MRPIVVNKPHEEFSIEEYENEVRINSSAAFVLSRACSKHMKQKKYGKIINMTSLTLTGNWEGFVPYVASKGAMYGLVKSMARELGRHGITSTASRRALSCRTRNGGISARSERNITAGSSSAKASNAGSSLSTSPIWQSSFRHRRPTLSAARTSIATVAGKSCQSWGGERDGTTQA